MYNIRRLANVARRGLADMLPAARQAFNDDPTDDRLPLVYGHRGLPWPGTVVPAPPDARAGLSLRTRLILVALLATMLGTFFAAFASNLPGVAAVNWPAVLLGAFHALVFRRYLFSTAQARAEDYPWLAASLAPSLAVVALASFIGWLITGQHDDGAVGLFAHALVSMTHALGVAAALIIAVAALCYSRDWLRAIVQLCVRLLVFRIMVWVTTLVVLEIGIVGPIVAALLRGVFGISLPPWVSDLADAISYAVIMSVIYLAVIGGTWTVCRQSFPALLDTGDVDVLAGVARLAQAPKRDKKKKGKNRDAADADQPTNQPPADDAPPRR